MISALEALERLREGNRRFVSDMRGRDTLTSQARRNELAAGQAPFAIILGCSDSRVPAEIVFDQGLGDLFVIRVAGNIVASSQVGSVEFAAARFGTRLVVVLGHSQCGVVLATLEDLQQPTGHQSRNLRSIVDRVRPSVEGLLATELRHDPEALVRHAVWANIRVSANHLRHGSEVLEQLIESDGLLVVGAEYSLETGFVDFFDGMPETEADTRMSKHERRTTSSSFACDLSALDESQRKRRALLAEWFQVGTVDIKEIPGGYAFHLHQHSLAARHVDELVALEQRCCAFLQLRVRRDAGGAGPVLEASGDEGVKEFVAAQFGI